jgi:hypothetical protein
MTARILSGSAAALAAAAGALAFAGVGAAPVALCAAGAAGAALAAAFVRPSPGRAEPAAEAAAAAAAAEAAARAAAALQKAEAAADAAAARTGALETERAERSQGAAWALRRIRFADAVLGKVPRETEKAAFELMERLAALRDQSAKTQAAVETADKSAIDSTAVVRLADQARSTMARVRDALTEMRRYDRAAVSGLTALGKELRSGIELLAGIEEITERSRLIAFNMAIEAARIGESGRGFKVIVGELRSLNDRTADFSRQVTELLERFKRHNETLVQQAIASSEHVADAVDQGVDEEEAAIESLLSASTACVDLSGNVSQVVRSINRELDGILESLQFQDITRQMVEGAQATLADAAGDLKPLAASDAAAEAGRVASIREQLMARAKTRGEKEAIQEVTP